MRHSTHSQAPISRRSVLAAAVLLGVAAHAESQETSSAPPPSIRVTADSVVSARPDRVQIDVGVITEAAESQNAAAQNAVRLTAVLTAVRKALGPTGELKTISFAVTPNYRYPKEGGNPTVIGYTATNVVQVTLDDVSRIGTVIDAVSRAGSNQIQRLQFTLKDEQAARTQALSEAARKARLDADALAAALGVKVTRILSVVEGGAEFRPIRPFSVARAATASEPTTPVEAGVVEVRVSVTLTVEVGAH